MASGKHVHKLEGFPRRLQIRQMLLDGYTMKPEEFKVSEHYGVYQTISAWFEKMEKKYETSSGEEKEVVDNMYSEACSLCGQEARRVRAKLDLESMKGINGSADAPHWSFQIPPMVFEARAFGEEGAAAVFKELERSTFLKRVSFRNPPANVLSHVNRPDKPSKDRESDTYHIRVAALKLRDGAQEIVDEMATMVVNSGTQLTAMRKLHAASVDRQKWSQTTQLKEHCWPEVRHEDHLNTRASSSRSDTAEIRPCGGRDLVSRVSRRPHQQSVRHYDQDGGTLNSSLQYHDEYGNIHDTLRKKMGVRQDSLSEPENTRGSEL